jgi:alkylation response protein AidB-like acyl-CoA dehydrogenase
MGNALNLTGLALTPEQGKFKRTARKLADDVLSKNAETIDREGRFPHENIKAIAEAGLLALPVSKEQGGPGGSILSTVFVVEELARGCASTAMCYTMHMSAVPLIAALVGDSQNGQREKFLDPILRGEMFLSVAMTEPGSGNRLWHMDSFAVEEEDHYLIDSFKSFSTSAGASDYYLAPLRANENVGPNDLSLFLIPSADPNVKPIGVWDGMGLRGNSSRPVHFDKVKIPKENRLGDPTCGLSMLFSYCMPIYQVGLAAVYLGLAQSALDAATAHVKKRIHSDTKSALSTVETVQRYVAEMYVRLDQARHLVYRVAGLADNALVLFEELRSAGLLDEVIRENPDDPFFIECAEVKIAACEMATYVAHTALQVCGGSAYRKGHPTERAYRDARAGSVMGPSDDALKLIMGRQLLGIPQPWEF